MIVSIIYGIERNRVLVYILCHIVLLGWYFDLFVGLDRTGEFMPWKYFYSTASNK